MLCNLRVSFLEISLFPTKKSIEIVVPLVVAGGGGGGWEGYEVEELRGDGQEHSPGPALRKCSVAPGNSSGNKEMAVSNSTDVLAAVLPHPPRGTGEVGGGRFLFSREGREHH